MNKNTVGTNGKRPSKSVKFKLLPVPLQSQKMGSQRNPFYAHDPYPLQRIRDQLNRG
jgi:hypothetical protein